jgi:ferric-dicitrate binding protein FerR (iron transport regulator)
MNDDYLWDPRAPVDDDIAKLERALAPLSAKNNPRALPSLVARSPRLVPLFFAPVSLAAAVLLAIWPNAPMLDENKRALVVGDVVDGAHEIELGPHGIVHTDRDARVRVVKNTLSHQEIALERGGLSAIVDAPPRFFSVRTPSVRAVDLGCAYSLRNEGAHTRLTVTSGAVVLEGQSLDLIVPAGASALDGGLPYRTGADAKLIDAADRADVDAVLALAGPNDAVTIWYAAMRTHDARAFARLRTSDDVDAMYRLLDRIERDLDHNNAR